MFTCRMYNTTVGGMRSAKSHYCEVSACVLHYTYLFPERRHIGDAPKADWPHEQESNDERMQRLDTFLWIYKRGEGGVHSKWKRRTSFVVLARDAAMPSMNISYTSSSSAVSCSLCGSDMFVLQSKTRTMSKIVCFVIIVYHPRANSPSTNPIAS